MTDDKIIRLIRRRVMLFPTAGLRNGTMSVWVWAHSSKPESENADRIGLRHPTNYLLLTVSM